MLLGSIAKHSRREPRLISAAGAFWRVKNTPCRNGHEYLAYLTVQYVEVGDLLFEFIGFINSDKICRPYIFIKAILT